jgi:hypothetical protein
MPCLKNPHSEAKRIAAVRASLQRVKPWQFGAFYGNVSPEGLRQRGQNSYRDESHSIAVQLAQAYGDAVVSALGKG